MRDFFFLLLFRINTDRLRRFFFFLFHFLHKIWPDTVIISWLVFPIECKTHWTLQLHWQVYAFVFASFQDDNLFANDSIEINLQTKRNRERESDTQRKKNAIDLLSTLLLISFAVSLQLDRRLRINAPIYRVAAMFFFFTYATWYWRFHLLIFNRSTVNGFRCFAFARTFILLLCCLGR